ncbi:hypothetical protein [Aestuariivirga litoralis]|uniref:hypothetical protein n=1 Tax=Aestuariivirga litoralis TaxID=2650924 RepID=UPI0018C6D722|nr:hypothetical protein [Aestuariivirga litoralis]MBG1230877.1 hypothetical protein [Aestuariivirga litoralis]
MREYVPLNILSIIGFAGFVLQAAIYYPGQVYRDVWWEYLNALHGSFGDLHPPIMALFWELQIVLLRTANVLYITNLAMYWLAFYLVLQHWPQRRLATLVLLTLGFAPFSFPALGIVLTDVGVAGSAMLACALILDAQFRSITLSRKRGVMIGVLLFYATFLRHNAPFLTAPLIMLALGRWNRLISWQPIVAIGLTLLLIGFAPVLNRGIIRASNDHSSRQLMIYDLAGISNRSRSNRIPGNWTDLEIRQILENCYSEKQWDAYAPWGKCSFVTAQVDNDALPGAWIRAIAQRPLLYAEHRLANFNYFMNFIGEPWAPWGSWQYLPGYSGDKVIPDAPAYKALRSLYYGAPTAIWYMPYFWLSLNLAVFIMTSDMHDRFKRAANAMATASLLYLTTYLLFNINSHFRYAYPAIALCCLAIVTLITARLLKIDTPYTQLQKWLLVIPAAIIAVGVIF